VVKALLLDQSFGRNWDQYGPAARQITAYAGISRRAADSLVTAEIEDNYMARSEQARLNDGIK
jgi:hypothetical protein